MVHRLPRLELDRADHARSIVTDRHPASGGDGAHGEEPVLPGLLLGLHGAHDLGWLTRCASGLSIGHQRLNLGELHASQTAQDSNNPDDDC